MHRHGTATSHTLAVPLYTIVRVRLRVRVCVCVRVAHVKPRHGLVCNITLPRPPARHTICSPRRSYAARSHRAHSLTAAVTRGFPSSLHRVTLSGPPPCPFNEGQFISPYYFFSLSLSLLVFHPILFFTLFRHPSPSAPPVYRPCEAPVDFLS